MTRRRIIYYRERTRKSLPEKGEPKYYPQTRKYENTKVLYLGKAGSSPYLIYATTTDYNVNNPILKY